MKTRLLATALSLSTLLAPALAFAQQHDDNGGPPHGGPPPASHSEPAHNEPAHVVSHPATTHTVSHTTTVHTVSHPAPVHTVSHPAPVHEVSHNQPQHVVVQQGPSHNWQRGDHYTGGRTVVDWHHYHGGYAPPQGYEWVQDGNNLVLIAVASGIIASVLANAAYN